MNAASHSAAAAPFDAATLERIQRELRAYGLDGWLLWDFHGANPVAGQLLGLPVLTRRYFVLLPAEGRPFALTHRIEQQPWESWPGEKQVYLSWRELEAGLSEMLAGRRRVAMEYVPDDAVPYVDRTPAGVVELVRAAGPEVVSSADLVSTFYSRWSPEQQASHRRAAVHVAGTVQDAFRRVGECLRRGESITEWELREWVCNQLADRGLAIGVDSIVAVGANAANPHYYPTAQEHREIREGDLLLVDLFGKESEEAIYADQTWMAYVGEAAPERLQEIFAAVRDGRDAAVELLRERWSAGEPIAGFEVDDAARAVIAGRGFGDHFIHRTGHSIDRELHGSGPNLDNLETRDTRRLIPGVGFSVEPGIYLTGDVGFRSEINVFFGTEGPEVTPAEPQRAIYPILASENA
ncbi:MAG TPA: M24 family metallopeptidase [Longimicrobiaceae bacterium]|nr:M24 family metallopeptidase [Longimicrobiaceae bacterium]